MCLLAAHIPRGKSRLVPLPALVTLTATALILNLSEPAIFGALQPEAIPPKQGTRRTDHLGMVGLTGLEPVTLRLSSACSNQLSYRPGIRSVVPLPFSYGLYRYVLLTDGKLVEAWGFEPQTYSLQSYRSTN